MPVSNQKPAAEWLQRELDSGGIFDFKPGRLMMDIEVANVCYDCEAVWPVHSVDAVNGGAADERVDEGNQHVCRVAEKRDVNRATETDDLRRQATSERCDLPRFRINSRDPARCHLGHVDCAI